LGIAIVTEPSTSTQGKVVVLRLSRSGILSTYNVNPDNSGRIKQSRHFRGDGLLRQPVRRHDHDRAGSAGRQRRRRSRSIPGPGRWRVDTKDNLLLVLNEGTGTITLVDLKTGQIVGRISAVTSENEDDDKDNKHDDQTTGTRRGTCPALFSNRATKAEPPDHHWLERT
jgi:hypothetical protein